MSLKVALCQTHAAVGAIEANANKITAAIAYQEQNGADLVAFGELTVCGYHAKDLMTQDRFIEASLRAVKRIAAATSTCTAIVGFPERSPENPATIFNSAAICQNGEIVATYRKQSLPNYLLFDEERYFTHGDGQGGTLTVADTKVALGICEDGWVDPTPLMKNIGPDTDMLLTINASPFDPNASADRSHMLRRLCESTQVPVAYVNLVGAQDGVIFDGDSQFRSADGKLVTRAQPWEPNSISAVLTESSWEPEAQPDMVEQSKHQKIWRALTTGISYYFTDNSASKAIIGLSGGIDSALTTCLAANALGAQNVTCVLMPSEFSSTGSIDDSVALCERLGTPTITIPITSIHQSLRAALIKAGLTIGDLTDQNLQPRARGTLLMALSNELGGLVLATGNKSELAVGYSTIYGDTVGAFAPLMDLWKTEVYELADWFNKANDGVIGNEILTKPASAELKPAQTDEQTLGDYVTLDKCLALAVEEGLGSDEIAATGIDHEFARRVTALVRSAEFKRNQYPIGARVSTSWFGGDRRMPITNQFET